MTLLRTSRELAERVEIDSQKHVNRFRRTTWIIAFVCGLATAVWLTYAALQGEQRIYDGGRVSRAHRMFENDCAKCHTEWSVLERLTSLNDSVASVAEEKCVACHDGAPHFVLAGQKTPPSNPLDAHHGVACATCHREHDNQDVLSRVADQHCVKCHQDLRSVHPGPIATVDGIQRFEQGSAAVAHPDFALQRALAAPPGKSGARPDHVMPDIAELLEYFERPGEAPRWQDAAQIRFNHALHLKPGLPGKDGQPVDLSRDCQACHQPDAERRLMLPIRYEQHCRSCHPLFFDTQYPAETVPHERPEIVRGFLTDFYAVQKRDADAGRAGAPARPRPGQPDNPNVAEEQGHAPAHLPAAAVEQVRQQVAGAEQAARQHLLKDYMPHIQINQFKRSGGCGYCHTVTVPADSSIWKIQPPRIPERWLPHSRFSHDSHRIIDCTECHRQWSSGKSITESRSTGDVLIPGIELCRQCHTATPAAGTPPARKLSGARTDCVECHRYHQRNSERFRGTQTIPQYFGDPDASPHRSLTSP